MQLVMQVDNLSARADLLDDLAPNTARQLQDVLPITDAPLLPSCWSGAACELDLGAYGLQTLQPGPLVCSLYPGTIAVRPSDKILLISYGAAESRSPQGADYAIRIGRITENEPHFLAQLARSHDLGELRLSLNIA